MALVGVATAASIWLGSGLGAPEELLATTGLQGLDLDLDGLVDIQEVVSGTDILSPDGDLDGIRDLEELARGLDPLSAESPQNNPLSVAFAARAHQGLLHLTIALYAPDGDLSDLGLDLGLQFAGQKLALPWSVLLPFADSYSEAGSTPGSVSLALSLTFPESLLQALGPVGFYALLAPSPGQAASTAATINLGLSAGTAVSFTQISGGGTPTGPGVTLVPIAPPGDLPVSFAPNQICFQSTELVGSADGVVIYEVLSADCVPSTKSCSSECPSGIGGTLELLDPLGLIGG
jgi:hypothetical protein